ncbi:MAG: right-handed parallel beta-helix repeat-containing protein [Acidobacteria bacterium]|nr:right-handed parallel beta-helix repeat-containing protein [Acidobacteriota bacterium]
MKAETLNLLFIRRVMNAMLPIAAMLVFVVAAQAQNPRAYVSVSGIDAGTCNNPANPCRFVSYALSVVDARGDVVILDSGYYRPFSINKAVTIAAAPGVYAQIQITEDGGTGIQVSTAASDYVVLRGLAVHSPGGDAGQIGIRFNSGGSLHVENCTINGFTLSGITSSGAELFVKDTTIRNSGYSVHVVSGNGNVTRAVLENCRIENGIHGIHANSNARVTAKNTTAVGNSGAGFLASLPVNGGIPAEMNLENCVSSNNAIGINANVNTTIRVSNSTVTGNTTGLTHNGALLSRYNNTVEGNTVNGNFSGFFTAK